MGLLVACGDDEDTGGDEPVPTVSGDPTDPRVGGLEAARQLLRNEGIDGEKGDLSNPVDCADLPGEVDADFCLIDDASVYAPGLVILYVARPDDRDDVWEVRVEHPERGQWEVTNVEPVEDQ
jgi:hypothetical protein